MKLSEEVGLRSDDFVEPSTVGLWAAKIKELEQENETLKTGFMILSGKVDNFRIYSYAEQELLSEVDDLIKGK